MKVFTLNSDIVRAVFTTDWHISDQPPGRRTGNYRHEIMEKIRFAIAHANKIGGVSLCGGDVYHVKDARNFRANSHALQTSLETELQQAMFETVFGAPGNHDLWADRVASLPTQPLGTLIASGAFTDISTESVIFENQDGSIRVQVDAFPYDSDDLAALDRVLNAPPREEGVTYRVVLMHQYGDPGNDPTMHGSPIIGFNKMAECDYDLALWGHDHSRTEPVTVGNCTHIRLGSLARAALAEDQVDRPINAAVFGFGADRIRFKEVTLPTQPLQIAFTQAARAVEKVEDSDIVTEFFEQMEATVTDIESTDAREVLQQLCGDDKKLYDTTVDLCGGL